MGAKCCATHEVKEGQKDLLDSVQPVAPQEEVVRSSPTYPEAPEQKETPAAAPPEERAAQSEFTITIKKTAAESRLGVDVDLTDGIALQIDKVNDGLINDWNKEHPDKQVKPNDRVISVNGAHSNALTMTDVVKRDEVLEMVIKIAEQNN
eukprot:CAMPEP_0179270408 /NCGR_PEP_ID=MMETSP0797-20121207/31453_1 /TAXON_ID=47934 /ORGANISM="Dinophysis acuminata, Strain DAEP01" /LENGTH=149 /DNA_ID=CAMNT_0020978745 /DNA_START=163 /DNA_END=612 /DNA_ORIENTATION=+